MTPAEFLQRAAQAVPASRAAAALAHDLIEDARYPASCVLRELCSSVDPTSRMKARTVLAAMRGLALVPLAETAPLQDMHDELWVIRTLGAEMAALRKRAAAHMRELLTTDRVLPVRSADLASTQPPPVTRVCDLAYVLLHRMLHLESDTAAFYASSSEHRTAAIDEFKQSRNFLAFFETNS